jgi:3-oxoadipyl-CoA thiolase
MTAEAFICDYVRTPIGRYGGALAPVRADDLAAAPIRELMRRHPGLSDKVDEVFLGCANQAGEDNRNLARMALLLAGLPDSIPGATVTACAPRAWTRSRRRRGRSSPARSPLRSPAAPNR